MTRNSAHIYLLGAYIKNTIIPELKQLAQLAVSRADSLNKINAAKEWEKMLENEAKRKIKGYTEVNKIITMDAGASYQETITEEKSTNQTFTHSYEYNYDNENVGGFFWSGIGGSFTFGFNYNVTSTGSKASSTNNSKTYGYFIGDDDRGDALAVGIHYQKVDFNQLKFKSDDQDYLVQAIREESDNFNFGTGNEVFTNIGSWTKTSKNTVPDVLLTNSFPAPLFVYFAGTSSCPYEGGRRREKVFLSSDVTQRVNVPSNSAAVYTLKLGNESPSGETRTYAVRLVTESNPNGAIVKINGQPISGVPVTFAVKHLEQQDVTLTIERGPTEFNYQDIKIAFYSECEYDQREALDEELDAEIYKELSLDVSFIEPCSPVDISSPDQDWVVTPASDNKLSITLNEYEKADADLKLIRLQYRSIGGDGSWINISETQKNDLGDVFTIKEWNTALLKDGSYEIRAVAECFNVSLAPGVSTVVKGTLERMPPELVGTPHLQTVWDWRRNLHFVQ